VVLFPILIRREDVLRAQNIWVIRRPVDLLLASLPLGLVDGINPILNLHDDAPVRWYSASDVGTLS
jgi:hypothetical protein